MLQAEFSLKQMLAAPVSGRVFFENLISENLYIGRPDKVSLIFARRLIRTGPRPTPECFYVCQATDRSRFVVRTRWICLVIYRLRVRMISRLLRPSAILQSTYSRVAMSVRIRVNAMVLMARFRRRSPPRLSRCRTVFPEDAGIGQVPAIIAKAASDRMRPG